MRRYLTGARCLLTGASSGIGRALALRLARCSTSQVLVARDPHRLSVVAAEVRSLGATVEIVAGDITDERCRAAALAAAEQSFGGLDVLISNAGVGAVGRFADSSPDRLRRVIEVNFFAAVELLRAALPVLKRGNRPLVVMVGSILGHRATPQNSEYCASKFALRGFSESIRPELARLGIDLLLASPGATQTDFYEHTLGTTKSPPWKHGRRSSPDAVAAAIVSAMRRGKREIIPGATPRLLRWLNHLSPSLLDRAMRRYG